MRTFLILIAKGLLFLCVMGVVSLCLLYCMVWASEDLYDSPQKSDCIVVLGGRIINGSPSTYVAERLSCALDLYNTGVAGTIIVSGGGSDEYIYTEACAMKNWLVSRGVPKNSIISEWHSSDTLQNITYSKQIMDELGFVSAVICTSDFHGARALLIAEDYGIKASLSPSFAVFGNKWLNRGREVVSWLAYVLGV